MSLIEWSQLQKKFHALPVLISNKLAVDCAFSSPTQPVCCQSSHPNNMRTSANLTSHQQNHQFSLVGLCVITMIDQFACSFRSSRGKECSHCALSRITITMITAEAHLAFTVCQEYAKCFTHMCRDLHCCYPVFSMRKRRQRQVKFQGHNQ